MKKITAILLLGGLVFACSGESGQTQLPAPADETVDVEAVEQTAEQLEEALRTSQEEFESAQKEVDELLNGI